MEKLCCKWVSEDMITLNNTKWEINVPKELPEEDNLQLCDKGLFHYYEHPLLAVVFKDFDGCGKYTKLYEVLPEGKIVKDYSLCGATKLKLVKELEVPEITDIQRIAFGILCALAICKEELFVVWANDWLSGWNRSQDVAEAVGGYYAEAALSCCAISYCAPFYCAASCQVSDDANYSHHCVANAVWWAAYAIVRINSGCKSGFDLISFAQKAMSIK